MPTASVFFAKRVCTLPAAEEFIVAISTVSLPLVARIYNTPSLVCVYEVVGVPNDSMFASPLLLPTAYTA